MNKSVRREQQIQWNEGCQDPDLAAMDKTSDSAFDSHPNGPGAAGGLTGIKGAKDMGRDAAGRQGAATVTQIQKVDMTKEQKRAFTNEIKLEMRDMINNIAEHHTDMLKDRMTERITALEDKNNEDHTNMVDQLQRELLLVSEYCKR